MPEHVILFAGPMGAGKTTAIRALSDIPVVGTEAVNTERHVVDKPTTTVALDYGELTIGDDEKLRLYGVPGQRRFAFMWRILQGRAEGLVVLVAAGDPDPVGSMLACLTDFGDLAARGGVVVGITRTDSVAAPLDACARALAREHPELVVPLFTVDPRDPGQMVVVLMTLLANLEMRERLEPREVLA